MTSVRNRLAALAITGVIGATAGTNIPNTYQEPPARPNEIVSERTENSYTTDLGGGRRSQQVHTEPIHHRIGDRWGRPDLRAKGRPWLSGLFGKYESEITAGRWRALIDADDIGDYRLEHGEDWIAFDYLSGAEVDLETEAGGIKEEITLTAADSDTLRWTVTGSAVPQWDGAALSVGSIRTLPLVAWDANRKPVELTAEYFAGALTVVVDTVGVSWPVTVDPSTTVSAARSIGLNAIARTGPAGDIGLLQTSFYTNPSVNVSRVFLAFPLASTAAGAYACSLTTTKAASGSLDSIYVLGASASKPAFTTADWTKFDGYVASASTPYTGTILARGYPVASVNRMPFSAAGLDSVRVAGGDTLWLALMAAKDYKYTTGVTSNYYNLTSPTLSIYYTVPADPGTITVTPLTATSSKIEWTGDTSTADSLRLVALRGTSTGTADSVLIGYLNAGANADTVDTFDGGTFYEMIVQGKNALGAVNSANRDYHHWYNQPYSHRFRVDSFTSQTSISAVYGVARARVAVDSLMSSAPDTLGQRLNSGKYEIHRLAYYRSDLPDWNIVNACSLLTRVSAVEADSSFLIKGYFGTGDFPASGNLAARFYEFDGHSTGVFDNTKNIFEDWQTGVGIPGERTPWVFNAAGVAGMRTLTGPFRVVVASSRDAGNKAPGAGSERMLVSQSLDRVPQIGITFAFADSLPADVTVTAISTDSLLVTWRDRSISETGYQIVDAATGDAVSGVLAADTESARIGGLGTNTLHSWRVKAIGGAWDDSTSAADSSYTLAEIPGKATVSFPADSLFKFILDPNSNPDYTEFAVQDSLSGLFVYAIPGPDSFGTAPFWGTFAAFGGAAGDTVAALPGKKYNLRVKARSGQ